VQEPEEPQLTPLQKAEAYKQVQMEVLFKFVKDFEDEEKLMKKEPDLLLQERHKDFDKRDKEETKRIEKLIKKEAGEVEELYHNTIASNPSSVKSLRDRVAKSISELLKQQKALEKVQGAVKLQEQGIDKVKADVATALKQKDMLHKICFDLLEKNYQLYLRHEEMLEEERKERQNLAAGFQDQMREVSLELEGQKKQREAELQENQEVRAKIQAAITDYKQREEAYRARMESHSKGIQ